VVHFLVKARDSFLSNVPKKDWGFPQLPNQFRTAGAFPEDKAAEV
jgi:hypothetical protein